jgi:hypothetical protein
MSDEPRETDATEDEDIPDLPLKDGTAEEVVGGMANVAGGRANVIDEEDPRLP